MYLMLTGAVAYQESGSLISEVKCKKRYTARPILDANLTGDEKDSACSIAASLVFSGGL